MCSVMHFDSIIVLYMQLNEIFSFFKNFLGRGLVACEQYWNFISLISSSNFGLGCSRVLHSSFVWDAPL